MATHPQTESKMETSSGMAVHHQGDDVETIARFGRTLKLKREFGKEVDQAHFWDLDGPQHDELVEVLKARGYAVTEIHAYGTVLSLGEITISIVQLDDAYTDVEMQLNHTANMAL